VTAHSLAYTTDTAYWHSAYLLLSEFRAQHFNSNE
jgi:hypothetical protein